MYKYLFFFLLLLNLSTSGLPPRKVTPNPVKIILDTDIGPDFDDAGAMAVLHAMADSGKAEILGTMACNRDQLVVPTIEVINTFFGRPGIPIGSPKSKAVSLAASSHWPDSICKNYPHKYRSTEEAPDAVTSYRKILASQPDTSVTIVSIGFLTNLNNLLLSAPDAISKMSGKELISIKVKKLVSMAGWFPSGKEFNVYMDSTASVNCFENWPTKIIFTGFEIGKDIFTGLQLVAGKSVHNPVKDAFRIAMKNNAEDRLGHMSWDQTAIILAVYGTDPFFTTVSGKISVNQDGSNTWKEDLKGNHKYVVQKMPVQQLAQFIEKRMMHLPAGN